MKIEVLYVPDCPNLPLAVERVQEALALENIQAEIEEIAVRDNSDANRLEFPGSPTIRVNNRDVEPAPLRDRNAGVQCRLYPGAQNAGVPDRESIVRALREAVREEARS
ncbi:MAG: DF family (seleno)protein [Candidatus Acidiferrales bacterium]